MTSSQSFGEWLRRRRRELDLTQDALARQVGCARITVRKLEADEIRPSKELAQLLAEQLGVPLDERATFVRLGRSGVPIGQTRTAPRHNLPGNPSTFIGRERELAAVKRVFKSSRLLTLTGSGGIGKTRLALQAASQLLDGYQDGVWWVELAALNDPTLVPQTVAKILSVREVPNQPMIETLVNQLRAKQLLLALDNCEHLIDACAQLVNRLLTQCPNLQILATSRESLGILGESVYQVPTLLLPTTLHLPVDQVLEYEATRLFVERAFAVQSDLVLNEQNAVAIGQICQRLDGIPLAIELAAARANLLTPEHIAARLDDRFNLLTRGNRTALPRQQTLRATIDWSYDLLPDDARKLFRRLSVFAGGFTLAAAQTVCSDEQFPATAILYDLARLVDRSLVLVEQQDEGERYRMLDTIREYARGKLCEVGEEDILRDRHLAFLVTLADEAEQHLFDAEATAWLDRLETERDNLRAAMEWSLEGERAASGLRLMAALWYFWFSHGPFSEARARLEQGLERSAAVERTRVRANALNALGILNWGEVNQSDLGPRLEEALAIGTELGDKAIVATSLRHLGLSAHLAGNYGQARTLLEQSLVVGRELGPLERHRNSLTLLFLGDVILNQGDSEQAKILYQESIISLGETQNKNFLAYAIRRMGQLASDRGDSQRATELCKESLKLNLEVGDWRGVIACVAALAGTALEQGHLHAAAQLCGGVQVLLTATGLRLMQVDEVRYEHNLAATRARLDEVSFETASNEGMTMTREQAIEYALEEIESG